MMSGMLSGSNWFPMWESSSTTCCILSFSNHIFVLCDTISQCVDWLVSGIKIEVVSSLLGI